eukprot:TRINITY_DN15161_c0_g1_i1.p1 TRINITY_DN15161_c0_g1~~TRINITY_DN15161_c0_g1_i1.p1  ORF type:complete len:111 (-),score=8.86 TRINITY_DN15161_c0_g1_i1:97-429(-)
MLAPNGIIGMLKFDRRKVEIVGMMPLSAASFSDTCHHRTFSVADPLVFAGSHFGRKVTKTCKTFETVLAQTSELIFCFRQTVMSIVARINASHVSPICFSFTTWKSYQSQ